MIFFKGIKTSSHLGQLSIVLLVQLYKLIEVNGLLKSLLMGILPDYSFNCCRPLIQPPLSSNKNYKTTDVYMEKTFSTGYIHDHSHDKTLFYTYSRKTKICPMHESTASVQQSDPWLHCLWMDFGDFSQHHFFLTTRTSYLTTLLTTQGIDFYILTETVIDF